MPTLRLRADVERAEGGQWRGVLRAAIPPGRTLAESVFRPAPSRAVAEAMAYQLLGRVVLGEKVRTARLDIQARAVRAQRQGRESAARDHARRGVMGRVRRVVTDCAYRQSSVEWECWRVGYAREWARRNLRRKKANRLRLPVFLHPLPRLDS